MTEGGSRPEDDAGAKTGQVRGRTCPHKQTNGRQTPVGFTVKAGYKRDPWLKVTEMNTCSKPGLLLSFSQMAVGAKVGVGGRRWVRRFGPTFPLNEVGDPALSQGGGLCYMVPHCLRDAWTNRERQRSESEAVSQGIKDI